jgi:hypothetical protein
LNLGGAIAIPVLFCVLSVFTRALTSVRIVGIDYDLISYTFCIVYFIYLVTQRKLIVNSVFFFLFLFSISFMATMMAGYPIGPYFKYFLPIFIIYIPIYHALKSVNIGYVFELYVQLAYYSAIFGLVQFTAKVLFGIKLLSVFSSPAIDSVAGEPSHYSALLMPALIYSIIFYKKYKTKSIVMFITMLLTLKITSYFTFAVVLMIAFLKFHYLLFLIPALIYIYFNYIILDYDFAYRIIPIWEYLVNGQVTSYNILHGTPLSFISNLEAAKHSLSKNLVFGVGFGGHESSYIEYYGENEFIGLDYLFGINARGGHSLSIRILSELGIIGLISYIWFLIKVQVFNKSYAIHRAIGIACLAHFVSKSVKLSSYIDYGTPFFFLVLLVNYQQYKYHSKNKNTIAAS